MACPPIIHPGDMIVHGGGGGADFLQLICIYIYLGYGSIFHVLHNEEIRDARNDIRITRAGFLVV